MSFVVAVVVVLSLLGCASSGELLDINLSGAPNSCGSQVVESINLFVDSEETGNLQYRQKNSEHKPRAGR